MATCRRFCGPCPSFKPNELQTVKPHALFCALGASEKPVGAIEDKGCSCFGCPVFIENELEGGYFCMHGIEGRK